MIFRVWVVPLGVDRTNLLLPHGGAIKPDPSALNYPPEIEKTLDQVSVNILIYLLRVKTLPCFFVR